MKVTVMSRWDAVFYCYEPHDDPAVIISISDPNMQYAASPFCSEENKVLELLPLCFADADQREAREEDLIGTKMPRRWQSSCEITLIQMSSFTATLGSLDLPAWQRRF